MEEHATSNDDEGRLERSARGESLQRSTVRCGVVASTVCGMGDGTESKSGVMKSDLTGEAKVATVLGIASRIVVRSAC